jgi:hypothetical protein
VKEGVKKHWWQPIDEELQKAASGNGASRVKGPLQGSKAENTGEGTRYGRRPKRPDKDHVKPGRKPVQ